MKNRKHIFIFSILMLVSLFLSACGTLLQKAEQAVKKDYGPNYTDKEHQTRTFNALWNDLEKNYIYYDTAKVDWGALQKEYAGRIDKGLTNAQFNDLIHELGTKLPEGALSFESRTERLNADTIDTSSYEGIGVIVDFQKEATPHIVILDVLQGSPAEKAGLKAHDSIYDIDGKPVLLEEGLQAGKRIRGPAGSTVTLNVKTPGKDERSIDVMRGKLTSAGKITAYQIKGTQYGYILFPPVSYTTMTDDVVKSLQAFTTNQKMMGLILDLRVANSSHGFPFENLLGLFMNGNIGEYYNNVKQTQTVTIKGQDQFSSLTVPLVILVGRNTAGFPEIMAASLQQNKRATVIGENTLGSVETASAFYLPDGSRAFIEIASFRLSNGVEIGNNGIKPDITLEAGWDQVLPNADPVLDKAISILSEQK